MISKGKKAESLLKVHNVEILVIPKEEYFKGLNDVFDQAQKGDLKSQPRQIILSSINELNSILTPERVKILKVIRDCSPYRFLEKCRRLRE